MKSIMNISDIFQKYIKRLKEEDEHVIDNQIVDIIFFQVSITCVTVYNINKAAIYLILVSPSSI